MRCHVEIGIEALYPVHPRFDYCRSLTIMMLLSIPSFGSSKRLFSSLVDSFPATFLVRRLRMILLNCTGVGRMM